MNLPNKITLLRVVIIPAFLVVYLAAPFTRLFSHPLPDISVVFPPIFVEGTTVGAMVNSWVALVLFIVAAVTDAIDGYLARKLGLVTNFGKLMDPLADKMLVCSAFIALTATGALPVWATIIFVAREFYVSGLRQLALEGNIVVAASRSAKIKTGIQIGLICYLMVPWPFVYLHITPLKYAVIIVAIAISIYSAVEYTLKNKELLGGSR